MALPSSVKVMFSLGGPHPAEVLALTEMLYIPAQMSIIKLLTTDCQHIIQTLIERFSLLNIMMHYCVSLLDYQAMY